MLNGLTSTLQEGLNSNNGNFKLQEWVMVIVAVNEVSDEQIVS